MHRLLLLRPFQRLARTGLGSRPPLRTLPALSHLRLAATKAARWTGSKEAMVQQYRDQPGRFTLGKLGFPTKAQGQAFVSDWLRLSRAGDVVGEEAVAWVRELLSRHPHASEKFLHVERVEVGYLGGFNCFMLRRADGSLLDISYRKCFMPSLNSPEKLAADALRLAVEPQTRAFRAQLFGSYAQLVCPETGTMLFNDANTHIDHAVVPFRELVDTFCRQQGRKLGELEVQRVSKSGGVQAGAPLADQAVVREFQEFHRQHAQLRAVSSWWNVRWAAKQRRQA